MDISTLVRAVIAAFEDASKLVRRIHDQRERGSGACLPEDPTRELLESLTLGPAIVRGHYEHDLKRFGESYACGDIQAREQMKDVLINLQMTLIVTLRNVYMDEMDLDFNTVRTASDDCRVNASVCLGQLSQRLSDAAKVQAYYPQNIPYGSRASLMPPSSPSLGYSSSRSTQSSAAFPTPRTPDPSVEQFGNLAVSPPGHPPLVDGKISMNSEGLQDKCERDKCERIPLSRPTAGLQIEVPSSAVHRINDTDARSLRRRSSQALAPEDNILLLFPQPGHPAPIGKQAEREYFGSSGRSSHAYSSPDISRASSGHRSRKSRDRFGPDDYDEHEHTIRTDGRQYSHSTIYDMYHPSTSEQHPSAPASSTSYSQRAQAISHAPYEHVRYLQENSRPPRPQPRSDSLNASKRMHHLHELYNHPVRLEKDVQQPPSRQFDSRPSHAAPIPVDSVHHEISGPPLYPLPQPPSHQHQHHASTASRHLPPTSMSSYTRTTSTHTEASSTPSVTLSIITTGPVTLPTDKNLLGFCKGAFRLQAGLERKAFSLVNRPAGLVGMTTSWKCEKCNFEGPIHETIVVREGKKKGKAERSFDPKVRTSQGGGVRYRWAFLARCHVTLKAMVPSNTALGREGAFGSFGCIFCCAEGKSRGWLDAGDALSTCSGSAGANGRSIASRSGSVRSGHTANTAIKMVSSGGSNGLFNPNGHGLGKGKGRGEETSMLTTTASPTPIFGNVASFMQHLETVHRGQDGWPNAEMVGRFRVVVARVAPADDHDWEVNLVPY
ncbi:hypothetical protein A1O1_03508 [Capronia coronata CBS 617.96]|uniref:Uncharacterized protein n=1 Tax=Capronia coronata CBS 617.96 TaxID=1182541 RepID=W9YC28_9EURO|nr:uncharacterized protein A1O1_03508 [Capronia coronata CBS 617.96]EXJ90407.1 hypothetical protein A1O1_03508 [Capronia coronata CBS 617.96]